MDCSNSMKTEFLSLVQELKKYWSDLDIRTLTELCINDIALTQFNEEIQAITASDSLIDFLTVKKYCSCMELRHLSRIAEKINIPGAINAIDKFKNAHHKRKICEFNESILKFDQQHPDGFVLITVQLNLHSQMTSIEDLTNCCKKLEQIASLPDGSYTLNSFKVHQGIEIILIVSSDYHSFANVRTKENYAGLRHLHIRYVQFDSVKIFANVLTKESFSVLKNVSSALCDTSMLII